ncbi:MAG: hypothetical protein AAGI30_08870 [Planctomycetota bacterium]
MTAHALNNASIEELQVELRRRERRVTSLQRKREKLQAQIDEIDAEITAYGNTASAGAGRRRPRNDSNLADALAQVLTGQTLSVTEAADHVQKAGYRTTSPNFRTIVNQTLLKDKRFKRVSRGKYTASGGGRSSKKRTRKSRG